MALRITQVFGQIGIDTYRSWMDIRQTPPKAHIEQRKPELSIEGKLPKVYIDQTQCFTESGLKPPLQLAMDFNMEGKKAAFEAIGRIAQEGTRLRSIEKGGNPIAEIAYEKSQRDYEITMVQMPKSRPDIEWDLGYLKIDWKPNPAKIEWETYTTAQINATKHRVDIYMKQWPDIKIEYIGNNIDSSI
ncbi:MAG: DUF6470 family protein [Caldicoprobacterales bacterium]